MALFTKPADRYPAGFGVETEVKLDNLAHFMQAAVDALRDGSGELRSYLDALVKSSATSHQQDADLFVNCPSIDDSVLSDMHSGLCATVVGKADIGLVDAQIADAADPTYLNLFKQALEHRVIARQHAALREALTTFREFGPGLESRDDILGNDVFFAAVIRQARLDAGETHSAIKEICPGEEPAANEQLTDSEQPFQDYAVYAINYLRRLAISGTQQVGCDNSYSLSIIALIRIALKAGADPEKVLPIINHSKVFNDRQRKEMKLMVRMHAPKACQADKAETSYTKRLHALKIMMRGSRKIRNKGDMQKFMQGAMAKYLRKCRKANGGKPLTNDQIKNILRSDMRQLYRFNPAKKHLSAQSHMFGLIAKIAKPGEGKSTELKSLAKAASELTKRSKSEAKPKGGKRAANKVRTQERDKLDSALDKVVEHTANLDLDHQIAGIHVAGKVEKTVTSFFRARDNGVPAAEEDVTASAIAVLHTSPQARMLCKHRQIFKLILTNIALALSFIGLPIAVAKEQNRLERTEQLSSPLHSRCGPISGALPYGWDTGSATTLQGVETEAYHLSGPSS